MSKNKQESRLWLLIILAVMAWIAIPVVNSAAERSNLGDVCASGQLSATLTGWPMDGKYPTGSAEYNLASKQLTVTAASVPLGDGTKLAVLIGDDRIGEMEPLKGGVAKAVITVNRDIGEDSRVRVLNGEMPIVSANLSCDAAAATPTPTPTASPTVSPTPFGSPSPSPSVSPTVSPTVSPLPSPTLRPGQ